MKRSDPGCILSLLRVCTGSGALQLGSHIAGVQEEHYIYPKLLLSYRNPHPCVNHHLTAAEGFMLM